MHKCTINLNEGGKVKKMRINHTMWSNEIRQQVFNSSIFAGLVISNLNHTINNSCNTVIMPDEHALNNGYYDKTNDIEIVLDRHKRGTCVINSSDIAKVQSDSNLCNRIIEGMFGYPMANIIDNEIYDFIESSLYTQNVGANGGNYADKNYAVIRNAIQKLDESNAPESDRYMIISLKQKNAMLGIEKFVSADKIGDSNVIRKWLFGQIYGVPIYIVLNTYNRCIMFHKSALAVCMAPPKVRSFTDIDTHETKIIVDIRYGFRILNKDYIVKIR